LALGVAGGRLVALTGNHASLRLAIGLGLSGALAALVLRLPYPLRAAGPGPIEELRPVLECVASRYQTGDGMYVYYGARPAFTYYNSETGWPAVMGRWFRGEPVTNQAAEISAALGTGRGWIIFSHAVVGEDQAILSALAESATTLSRCEAPGAHAELMQFSGTK
jgi:hypothetical protein